MFQRTLLAAVTAVCTFTALSAAAQTSAPTRDSGPVASRTVQVLPPDVSRALKFTRMPTTQSIPFIVGSQWQCQAGDYGLERCRLVLVVCTNDQSLCFEV